METSNSPELAPNATTETANPVENSAKEVNPLIPTESGKEQSLKENMLSRKAKEAPATAAADGSVPVPEKTGDVPATPVEQTPAVPKYEPNFKYKAFGKEKEIPEFFRGLIKDVDSEKQVREVFTRAEAFDDMKGRYENTSREHQQVLNNFTALDRDVRRVTGFLNNRDLDNFFGAVKLSDAEIIQYLQQKAQYMTDPSLKMQYQQQVQMRAEHLNKQEQFESLQSEHQNLAVQARTTQLDLMLSRPDVSGIASAWDQKAGEIGAFRDLVMQEAANHWHTKRQDLTAEQAVQLAIQRYGKFVAQAPASQPPVSPQQMTAQNPAAQAAPQAPQAVAPDGKPVIPVLNGKGTSPVKQAPKSLDDLRKIRKELIRAENQSSF